MITIEQEEPQNIVLNSIHKAHAYLKQNLADELKMDDEELEELEEDENLFAIGLDSIMMTDMTTRWKKELGIEVKNTDFLREPTLQNWAAFIYEKMNEKRSVTVSKDPILDLYEVNEAHRFEEFALNEIQNAYLVGRNTEIPWGGISCYGYFEVDAHRLKVQALQVAVNELLERHEMLRVRVMPNGFQRILPEATYPMQVYKREAVSDLETHLEEVREQMSNQIIPLEKPLFDLRVSEMNNNQWRIHFGMDFIASDALSLRLFWRDLYTLYSKQLNVHDVQPLPKIKASFRDYLRYIDLRKKSERYEEDKSYWLNRIDHLPGPPKLPTNKQVREYGHTAKDFVHFEHTFQEEKWKQFSQHAAQKKLTPTAALMSIFSEILSAWGAGEQFGIILTVFERDPVYPDIDKVIGDFTHLSLLSVNRENRSVAENAEALQWQMQEDLDHKAYSAIDVVKELNRVHAPAELFYPVVFTSALGVSQQDDLGKFGQVGYMSSQTPQVWLDSQVMIKNGAMVVAWDVLDPAFPSGLVESMFEKYTELINCAIMEPRFWEITLSDLRPKQQKLLHDNANLTQKTFANHLLHAQILGQAKREPNRTAIVCKGQSYSYRELVQKANYISVCLKQNHIQEGDRIAVQLQKSFESIAIILGIVQYGASYIPLSHNNPQSRTIDILNQAEAHGLISDQSFDLEGAVSEKFMYLKQSELSWDEVNFDPPSIDPEAIGYLIFTSGSTGKPKGVVITHKAAMNTILDVNQRFGVTQNDAVLGVSAYSFDLSVYDIFGLLGIGGKLVVPTEEERIDPKAWKDLIVQHHVTLWNSVPALFNVLLDSLEGSSQESKNIPLKKVFLSGDWIPLSTLDRMKNKIPQADLVSMGGATEASIWSNYYEVDQVKETWSSIPYGYPLSNQAFYILDDFRRRCPTLVKGKLHIAGEGLAESYWGQKELTEKAFFVHPKLKLRLYDTGDYGQYLPEGIIEFLGRQDDQLKINGYRIEIGEIQMAFRKCNQDLDPVILPIGEKAENKKLVAFVKTSPVDFSERELKNQLAQHLPPYFIPDQIVPLASYPMTNNGKIDRRQLINNIRERETMVTKGDVAFSASNNENGLVHPVLKVVREVFDLPTMGEQDQFAELGVSSMDIIRLSNQLEASFFDRPSVGDMVRYGSVADLIQFYQDKDIQFTQSQYADQADSVQSIDPQFLLYTPEQMQYLGGISIIEELEERQAYKKKRVAERKDLTHHKRISLADETTPDLYAQWRKTYRGFLNKSVPFAEFKGYLNLCAAQLMDGKARLNYASAGGIYPLQIYVTVFKDKVERVEEGYYYFNSYTHDLVLLSQEAVISPTQLNFNHDWLEESAFAVHMVADMEAIYPIYQKQSMAFCQIESGLVSQLLESEGAHYNIGTCQLGGYDFKRVRDHFQLSERHFYLHSLVGGAIDFEQEKSAMQAKLKSLEWQKHVDKLNELLARCERKEVKLWVEEDKLKFKSPEGALDQGLFWELKEAKPHLFPYLQSETYSRMMERHERFDLTPIQAAFLMGRDGNFELGNVGSHYYSELEWPYLDTERLEQMVNHVIGLHDALRTVIYEDGTQAVLFDQPYYKIRVTDDCPNEIRAKRGHHKYPLGKWPMFHFEVSNTNTKHTILHTSVDLLLLDAWSADLLMREIIKAYQGHTVKKPAYTFKQYISDEQKWHQKHPQFMEKAENYWASKLENMPGGPALPYQKPLTEIKQPRFKRLRFSISDEAIRVLTQKAERHQLSPTAVFATLFSKLLSYWSGGEALTLNMTLFNRLSLHPDVNEVMGDFTNVALISYFPEAEKSFLKETTEIQEQLWQAVEYRAKNGLELLRALNKNQPGKAVMPVVFTSLLSGESADLENNFFPKEVKEVYAVSQTPQVVIDHQIYRRGDAYLINWDVVEEAFDCHEVNEIFGRYEKLINEVAASPDWNKKFEI